MDEWRLRYNFEKIKNAFCADWSQDKIGRCRDIIGALKTMDSVSTTVISDMEQDIADMEHFLQRVRELKGDKV